jgi:hypothetical protein
MCHIIICIAKHSWLSQPRCASIKISLHFLSGMCFCDVWLESKNPKFENHRKYLVCALCKLRCMTVLYTSVKCRVWAQVQPIKWSFKFEFEFGIQNLLQVFRFEFKFKFEELLKDFPKSVWSTKSGICSNMWFLTQWCPWMIVWSLNNHQWI